MESVHPDENTNKRIEEIEQERRGITLHTTSAAELRFVASSPTIELEPKFSSTTILNSCDRARYRWTGELDVLLRDGYRGDPESKQRAIDQICLRTGWPRQTCWDRARALHLSSSGGRQSRHHWSDEEIARIRSHRPRQHIADLATQLGRSVRSVREKLKRLKRTQEERRPEDNDHAFYSVNEVAGAIGRNSRIVYRWVKEGRLTAAPDPVTGELRVEERDFWNFITMNYEEVLVHKVSRDYLEWLCAELLPLARPRIVQKGGRKRAAAAGRQNAEYIGTDNPSNGL